MRAPYLLMLLSFTFACSDADKGTNPGTTDTDTGVGVDSADDSGGTDDSAAGDDTQPPPCEVDVVAASPTDGDVGVLITVDPTFTLSGLDETATITTDIPGAQQVSEDGLTLTWVVDGDLDWETSYTLWVNTCSAQNSVQFTTEDAPEPANDLVGRTWIVDLNEATLAEPSRLATFLDGSLSDVLIGVSAAYPGTVDLRIALADTRGEQETCSATADWVEIGYLDRDFDGYVEVTALPLVGGDPVDLYKVSVSGTWSADGTVMTDGVIAGMIDVRNFEDALGYDGDTICSLGAVLGFTCEDCPTGETYCVGARFENITGVEAGFELMDVPASDCPGCATGEPVCE